jgi:hypothetical protein
MTPRPEIPGIHVTRAKPGDDGGVVGHYIGTDAGPPLDPTSKEALAEATRFYALHRNRLDPEPIIERLAEDVVYDAQEFPHGITGREAVADRLRRYFARARAHNGDTGEVEVGEIGLPEAADHPCGIFHIHGRRRSLITLKLDDDNRIRTIFVVSIAPRPEEARGLGEVPR